MYTIIIYMYQIKIKATADDLFDSLLNLVDSKPCSLKVTAADYKGTIFQNYNNWHLHYF